MHRAVKAVASSINALNQTRGRLNVVRAAGAQRSVGTAGSGPVPPDPNSRAAGITLVGPGGAPVSSSVGKGGKAVGAEVKLTPQNVQQVLQNSGAILVQVGTLPEAAVKKINRLREAAEGRLPLAHLDCQVLPQVCQALQIATSPTVLLMARGQVGAALENEVDAPAATKFVEGVAKIIGLKVDFAEDITEQLVGVEELEWKDPAAADREFETIGQAADLPNEIRLRIAAGRTRCAIREPGRLEEARAGFDALVSAGHDRVAEVKQAGAMLQLADTSAGAPPPIETLRTAFEESPKDLAVCQAYCTALFWAGKEVDAFEAALKHLRRSGRSEESRQLIRIILEALGPRHPFSAKARRSFSNALFI